MKKKIAILGLGLLLGVSTVSTVFANDETVAVPSEEKTDLFGLQFGFKPFQSEEKLAEIAEEQGISVDELKEKMAEKGSHHRNGFKGKPHRLLNEEKLQQLADEKGLTDEELKQQLEAEREAKQEERLKALAKEKGITVEELKQQLEAKRAEMEALREQNLQEKADELGLTVEELKEKMNERKGKMHFKAL